MSQIRDFPSISILEFAEACKAIENRSADRLDGTDWVSVSWTGSELLIKQRKNAKPVHRELEKESAEQDIVEELIDIDNVVDQRDESESLLVDFSITLSPTYCVPILWFSCRQPSDGRPFNLEQVYKFLVPSSMHTTLRRIGVMGGISVTNHPISDLPSFFIHPCNTPDALSFLGEGNIIIPEEYLILWLGLIGSAVGLYLPSQLLVDWDRLKPHAPF